jgi:hypothetical protein
MLKCAKMSRLLHGSGVPNVLVETILGINLGDTF